MNTKKLNQVFQNQKLDVIISTSDQTRLWYTEFSSSAGYLFIEKQTAVLLIDSRYIEAAKKTAKNVEIKLLKNDTLNSFSQDKQNKYKRIGIEKEYLTIGEKELLTKLFPKSEFVLISAQELRIIKSEKEIKILQTAAEISLKALNKLVKDIKPGISEKELETKLENYLRQFGGNKSSFDAIIASGIRSSLPHGRASEKILEEGELVTIDFGVNYQGYITDITRTFHVGKVNNEKLLEIEKIVKEAQILAIKSIKPGISTYEIDKICRDYIKKHNYGDYFVHSTGHGIGIDVHELPIISSNNNTILEPGMVITVEPGIYIENLGGVRFEDDVLVTENGFKVLSSLS